MPNRLSRTLAQLGFADTCWYALARLCECASGGRWQLFKYALTAQAVQHASLCGGRGASITVRELDCRSASPAALQRTPAVLQARFGQGARCLAAYRDGELAGMLWFTLEHYVEDEVRACFAPGQAGLAWDFDVHIAPAHRGTLVFARLWDEANRVLAAQAVRWTCSRISAFNPASRAAHARMGARQLGTAVFLCCGRWQWTFATLAPFVHVAGPGAAPPRFVLRPDGQR